MLQVVQGTLLVISNLRFPETWTPISAAIPEKTMNFDSVIVATRCSHESTCTCSQYRTDNKRWFLLILTDESEGFSREGTLCSRITTLFSLPPPFDVCIFRSISISCMLLFFLLFSRNYCIPIFFFLFTSFTPNKWYKYE